MSLFAFGPAESKSPWPRPRAAITANDADDQAAQSSPWPSQFAEPGTLNDDQALALLMKNETVAGLLQNAFNRRVEEHQQKVERAYNQRLLELEEYTRTWRDATKELWMAVGEGTSNPTKDQQESLKWKVPREAGHDFDPERSVRSQETVEKVLDSDGRVARIVVKNSSTSASDPHFNLLNWNNSKGCGCKDFETWITDIKGSAADFVSPGSRLSLFMRSPHLSGEDFSAFLETPPSCGRIFLRQKISANNFAFFSWEGYRHKNCPELTRHDIVIDFSIQNMLLLWRAFSILTHRNTYLLSRVAGPLSELSRKAPEDLHEKLGPYYRSSLRPGKQRNAILSVSLLEKGLTGSGAYDSQAEGVPVRRRLVIARPYHKGKRVMAAEFFDAGSGTRTHRVSAADIVISEDTATLQDIGNLLEQTVLMDIFPAINKGHTTMGPAGESEQQNMRLVPKSSALPQPSLFRRTLALSDGLKELREEPRRGQSNPQPPKLEFDKIADDPSRAHGVEEEVLPSGMANQQVHGALPDDSANSDLIMLDEQPKNVTFSCRRKRPLPGAGQKSRMAKRPKPSTTGPNIVSDKQLPQNDPRGQPSQGSSLPLRSFTPTEGLTQEHMGEPKGDLNQCQVDTEHKRHLVPSTKSCHRAAMEMRARLSEPVCLGLHQANSTSWA